MSGDFFKRLSVVLVSPITDGMCATAGRASVLYLLHDESLHVSSLGGSSSGGRSRPTFQQGMEEVSRSLLLCVCFFTSGAVCLLVNSP